MQTILKYLRQAADLYKMIEEGDRIAVGVSGGKDSCILLYGLKLMSEFYPKKFSVVGITVDLKFQGVVGDFSAISVFCKNKGISFFIERTDIWEIVFKERKEENPCSLCSRMRKGALYDKAKELGCNKVALGHHCDDAAITFYMNLFNNGTLGCFSPVTELEEKAITVIRPLCLTPERDIIHAAKAVNIPTVKSGCAENGQTERAKTAEVLKKLNPDYKGLKEKAVGAMKRAHISGW